ncbi:Sec-independent protein translocase TatB [Microbacterium sp. YY-01]|uniref:Sec-independent protein translocase TatB n=1 Tax=Microbacterium sp. YY-01 TaxID=3421634 RepID=UPI003D1728AE
MFFGLTFEKLLVIGVIAAVIVGPERLPAVAEKFARFVKSAADYMRGAKDRMKEEFGSELNQEDWRKLDPRQYDPRRIIRDALLDDSPPRRPTNPPAGGLSAPALGAAGAAGVAGLATLGAPPAAASEPMIFSAEEPPPFDSEAT